MDIERHQLMERRRSAMKNKLFALVGPHASGKTAIVRELMKAGVHYVPLYTTRSPEAYANNPVGAATMYRFMDKADFFKQDFLVKITYKGEYYGMMKQEVPKSPKQRRPFRRPGNQAAFQASEGQLRVDLYHGRLCHAR